MAVCWHKVLVQSYQRSHPNDSFPALVEPGVLIMIEENAVGDNLKKATGKEIAAWEAKGEAAKGDPDLPRV